MRKIKLKESDLTKIIKRTIYESQLLNERPLCPGGAACDGCKEGLIKAGVGDKIECACFGGGCAKGSNGETKGNSMTPKDLSDGGRPKGQMGESYIRRNYRRN